MYIYYLLSNNVVDQNIKQKKKKYIIYIKCNRLTIYSNFSSRKKKKNHKYFNFLIRFLTFLCKYCIILITIKKNKKKKVSNIFCVILKKKGD